MRPDLHRLLYLDHAARDARALDLFRDQARSVPVYRRYLDLLGTDVDAVRSVRDIPFLPIELFKRAIVLRIGAEPRLRFRSSGTGGDRSVHVITDPAWYEAVSRAGFERSIGVLNDVLVLSLLPGYTENPQSSLIHMVEHFKQVAASGRSLAVDDAADLLATGGWRDMMRQTGARRTLLIGVSFALLDLAERGPFDARDLLVVETGGMKGRRRELTRDELHERLCQGLGVETVASEYGMTELQSQAWSTADGLFQPPPWLHVDARPVNEPFTRCEPGRIGQLLITDLANIDSCAFIETSDLGRVHADGRFEVIGRLDHADVRGCNLLYA